MSWKLQDSLLYFILVFLCWYLQLAHKVMIFKIVWLPQFDTSLLSELFILFFLFRVEESGESPIPHTHMASMFCLLIKLWFSVHVSLLFFGSARDNASYWINKLSLFVSTGIHNSKLFLSGVISVLIHRYYLYHYHILVIYGLKLATLSYWFSLR